MARVQNPTTFSEEFGIDPKRLRSLGVFDPTLAIDTRLFIDPLLLSQSVHREMRSAAVEEYRKYFERVIKFLEHSKGVGDVAWKTATRLLTFPEVRGTCLGYGAASIDGSGFGPRLTTQVLRIGKEIVDLGIRDPDLFPLMALLEAGIGPDRISDMTTRVVHNSLLAFNRRVLGKLGLVGEEFTFCGSPGQLMRNRFHPQRTPVVLVPRDVLRELPIASDWDSVQSAAAYNSALRERVNRHIGHIWAKKKIRDKKDLREQALRSKAAVQTLLDAVNAVKKTPYDMDNDPTGLVFWANVGRDYATRFPLRLKGRSRKPRNASEVFAIVDEILDQFRGLIENNGLHKELYDGRGKRRHESSVQRLFFAVAVAYCKANDLDISPEVDSGSGQIDFKFSTGFRSRVLVELKLSTNPKLIAGYQRQLEAYKKAEAATRAIYLVVDVGSLGKKFERLVAIKNAAASTQKLSDLQLVDGRRRASASKL